ncbi:MAG TPA: response regulator transcription factor [Dinghuibacter sp.]|jgi:DNA-binding NarL/FixJ family response regulator|uniref:response regulator transcription factor n=1 Tax=Dinghuibacter sp. TaxID=2024697 RepID=UPI002CCC00A4|nr:response regulator transcription factor [Dinghuibacter sp.]HTJ12998.1 response regulator transcription factor [Dinghuibacter sp.]
MDPITVALVDDHVLMRNGLAALVRDFGPYTVLFEADNGRDCMEKMTAGRVPDILLLDIQMPLMDGYETAAWLKEQYPSVKILALSMYDNETAIIRMLRQGVRGYVLKDIEPAEMRQALSQLTEKGYYQSELVTGRLLNTAGQLDGPLVSDREAEFLRWSATELTYKEIAQEMCLSPRTIDGYRDALFQKLQTKSRVGLVMYAIRNGIVRL